MDNSTRKNWLLESATFATRPNADPVRSNDLRAKNHLRRWHVVAVAVLALLGQGQARCDAVRADNDSSGQIGLRKQPPTLQGSFNMRRLLHVPEPILPDFLCGQLTNVVREQRLDPVDLRHACMQRMQRCWK